MKDYLIYDLGIPEERIQCLLYPHPNSYHENASIPSRANIVDTLLGLIDNCGIQNGDNIIIYFSGHGSSYACDHRAGDHISADHVCGIEALCPSDRGTKDANNNVITDITDRELNAILTQICRTKGRKITVILDCCHSSSLTRSPYTRVRSAPRLEQKALTDALRIAHNRMRDLPEYKSVLDPLWSPDMDSHVVLTACGEHEEAREEVCSGGDGRINGVFTLSLLRVLRFDLPDDLTYEGLLSLLPQFVSQTPVVAGKGEADRLWYLG